MSKLLDSDLEKARVDIFGLVESYGVKLEKNGKEFFGLCPFHNESSPSFSVTPSKGRYHCFGCGANGDSIQFVMDFESIGFRDAVKRINGQIDTDVMPRERSNIEREEPVSWIPMPSVPHDAPKQMDVVNRKISGTWYKLHSVACWTYKNSGGGIIGHIHRFDIPGGGKEVVPQTFCMNHETGELSWRWLSFSKPRPIYGLDLLAAYPSAQVLVVEGEKTCDAARKLILDAGIPQKKLIVISWPGGGKAIKHVNWSPIHGRSVGLWPDADAKTYVDRHELAGQLMPFLDQPGTVAMHDIYHAVKEHCTVKLFTPPSGTKDGWDLADELPEGFDIVKHMRSSSKLASDVFEKKLEVEKVVTQIVKHEVASIETEDEKAEAHDKLENPELTNNVYFRLLGYDHDRYYIFQFEKCQIMVYTKSDFSEPGLIELAPINWWENMFGGKKGGIDKKEAMNWMVRKAHSRGVYSMSRLRGRGAWMDAGRFVYHHGNYLTIDGSEAKINEFESRYVYEMAQALPKITKCAMSCEDGRKILDLARIFRWSKPASAALIAGWVALAPLGGAIKWRPHIWLSGGAGSGKSSILNRYVHFLMNGMDLYAQGNSSEAGIRQELKGDALPVLFDESESNNERESMRIQSVLSLVRQASTESQARTLKGTAGGDPLAFHVRSMFCLASIQVGIKYQADIERMTVLNLMPKRDDANAADSWKKVDEALYAIERDDSLPGRLIRRSIELLPITLKNILVFSEAGAMRFGSQRDGDQYGTLLAGAWSLQSRELVTLDQALGMIDDYDWSEHRENNEIDESERALASLMGALIRVSGSAEVSVNELLRVADGRYVESITTSTSSAEAILQRHGMRIVDNELVLSNSSDELRRLMQGTPFEADLRGVLLRVKGARRCEGTVRFNGMSTRAISIPLRNLLSDELVVSENGMAEF